MDNILTVNDVAKKLQMSPSTIYKMAEQGKIPSFKIGTCRRFFEEEIIKFLQNISQRTEYK
jgi:excisionase family DNA binding protein